MSKKHPQAILAVDAAFFANKPEFANPLNQYSYEQWLQEAQSHLVIREREALETDPTYRQLLPYVLVEQVGLDGVTRYTPYRRTKQVGEARLAGNVSVGFGGHIDLSDVYIDDKSCIGLQETIASAAARELVEELCIAIDGLVLTEAEKEDLFFYAPVSPLRMSGYFILDNANDVGRVHVGLVFIARLPANFSVSCQETELQSMTAMTARELLDADLPLEPWTRIILSELVAPDAA